MSLTPTAEQLAQALDNAGDFRVTRIGHLTGRQVVVSAVWQGKTVRFQATITEVLEGELPQAPRQRNEKAHLTLGRKENLYEQALTEDQCRQSDYPLYFAEAWLRREKERLGSFAAISREYGYPETNLIYAARKFGWPLEKPQRHEVKAAVQAEWLAGKTNKRALAEAYDVSVGSVWNWIKEFEDER